MRYILPRWVSLTSSSLRVWMNSRCATFLLTTFSRRLLRGLCQPRGRELSHCSPSMTRRCARLFTRRSITGVIRRLIILPRRSPTTCATPTTLAQQGSTLLRLCQYLSGENGGRSVESNQLKRGREERGKN